MLTQFEQRLSLAIAMVCISAVGTTMGLTWPLLSLILDKHGVSSGVIGLSAASQTMAIFAVAPVATRTIANYGLLRTISAALIGTVAMLALLPLQIDPYGWMPIRFLLGASVSFLVIACQTWINQTARDETRGLVSGILGFLWSAGFAAGPAIIAIVGIDGWPPFLWGIAIVLVAAVPLLFTSRLAPAIAAEESNSGLWQFLPLAAAALLAAPTLAVADSINDSFLSLYGLRGGLSQTSAVLLLATLLVGTTLGHLPFGWVADRVPRPWVLIATASMALLLTVLLLFMRPTDLLVWPAVFLFGAALGGIWTVAFAMVGDRFNGASLAAATTLSSVLYGVGGTLGPIVAGHAMDNWGPRGALAVTAIALATYLGICLKDRREQHRERSLQRTYSRRTGPRRLS
jgi:MFS family permease